MQGAAALAQVAEAAAKAKPSNQKQEQRTQVQQGVDSETVEISGQSSLTNWSDEELSATFRTAQAPDVRRKLAAELSLRRAKQEQQMLQAELQS